MLDQTGDPIGTGGAPVLGLSWAGEDGLGIAWLVYRS